MSGRGTATPIPGVTSLDHTADLGLELRAPDLPELFRRGAVGMSWLLLDRVPGPAGEERRIRVAAGDRAGLLRQWLRELLFRHDSEGFTVAEARVERVDEADGEWILDARVRRADDAGAPVREIKGVTLHGLEVERAGDDGWRGRVIFDV